MNLEISAIFYSTLLADDSAISVAAVLIGYNSNSRLLESGCRRPARGGETPPSYNGHLATVVWVGRGVIRRCGQTNRRDCGGEGDLGEKGQDADVITQTGEIKLGMQADARDISSVHFSVRDIVLANQHMEGCREHYRGSVSIEDAVSRSEDVAACYDGASTKGDHLSWRHQAHLYE